MPDSEWMVRTLAESVARNGVRYGRQAKGVVTKAVAAISTLCSGGCSEKCDTKTNFSSRFFMHFLKKPFDTCKHSVP